IPPVGTATFFNEYDPPAGGEDEFRNDAARPK
ncbi:MAG: hypothetical protein UU81_C0008G0001, partial [Microgenomates group bacterium GW2011_GWC1_41_8]